MKYQCIIFDCDGVLVDSEAISNSIFVEMAKEIGVEVDIEYTLQHFAGKSLKSSLEYVEDLVGKKLPDSFEKEYRKRTYRAFATELKPIKGIRELLIKIPVPIGVASSGPLEKIKQNLTTTGLIEIFGNKIFSSYEIGSWKPNPEIFEYAAEKMGFTPGQCAVVEDSIAGVKAAKEGGFDVFAYTKKNQAEFEHIGAKVFSEMSVLEELLIR